MSQINVNNPPAGEPAPPRRPPSWPLYAALGILLVIVGAVLATTATRRGLFGAGAMPTPTPTTAATATATSGASPTAVSAGGGAASPTATSASGATPTPAQPPTNPTSMHVASGSCSVHQITWSWSGAQRATAYDLVLYDPRTGATIRSTTTHDTMYRLGAGPGVTVALKIRSRNAAGAAHDFFTPGQVGRVPPTTPNPTHLTASTTGHRVTWFWTAVTHATAYDVVLYHYSGSTAKPDITARTSVAHWSVDVTPGITYYLKVRTVGACAPAAYYSPATSARAGTAATP